MEILDYLLALRSSMDEVSGEESVIEYETEEELLDIVNDTKKEAKDEIDEIGIYLSTDDIIHITSVYNAIAIYLFRNDSNNIMDNHEDVVDMFIALLEESGVSESDIPEIMENILIDNKFKTILELNYKDDTPKLELSPFSKYLLSKVTNEFKFIEPIKLVEAGMDKVFQLFDIVELEKVEMIYIFSLYEIEYNDIFIILESQPVDTLAIGEEYKKLVEEFKLYEQEQKNKEILM